MIHEMITESFNLIIMTNLDAVSGEGSVEETVKRYSGFVSRVKEFFASTDISYLSAVDGTTLSENLRVIGAFLAHRNEHEATLEAYKLAFATLSLIDPAQMSHEDIVACLYEAIDSSVQDLTESGDNDLISAIYELALHGSLAQDPTVQDGICQLRDQGSDGLLKPSWEDDDDDDDPPSIVEYHEGRGNIPSSISMEKIVPFDENAFSEGMHQVLGIQDRPIIAADIDTIIDLELQGFGISWAGDLAYMPRLRFVNLARNMIRDARYIAELHEVEILDLGDNQIEDLIPFAGMHSLRALVLSDNAIIDVSPLAGLTNLRDLNLDNNCIRSISPLSRLEGLETLSIAGNPLTDTHELLKMTYLQLLYVSREQVEEDVLAKLREQGVDIRVRDKPIAETY